MAIQVILLLIAAYLIGSIPTAYLIAKWRRGVDIRRLGTGNIGAANMAASVSKRWSIAVTLFDIGKGALMVGLARLVGLSAAQQAGVGLAAVIGHNWTVFLNFNGGRGIFTTLGVIIMLAPRIGLIAVLLPYLLFAPFKQLALGVTVTLILLPILAWTLSEPLGVTEPAAVSLAYLALLLIAMFRRVTAPKSALSASVPTHELILYRLLFDRDIRDRKAWISQTRPEANQPK